MGREMARDRIMCGPPSANNQPKTTTQRKEITLGAKSSFHAYVLKFPERAVTLSM
ncbi:S ribonuclease [Pyrus ussuriensis x Pyrus communis]|uniref:S ribonuclease n=1 Tax=Pyrus ussuriensis x Pyrus communis TaxID=2448454 RepID=A0A5N5FT93_9ROSA|nr:S ribonuclease [Pyrus ussuriensis x Pyrus communis]